MRFLLASVLLVTFLAACGQSRLEPTAEEQPRVDQFKEILFNNAKAFTPVMDGISKEKPMNGVPWKADEGEGQNYDEFLAAFRETVKGETDEWFGKLRLQLGAEVPESAAVDQKFFSITLANVDATDRNGKQVEFEEKVIPSFGSASGSRREGGKMISYSAQTVGINLDPKEGETYTGPYHGTATLALTNNDQFQLAEITAADKGKTVSLGSDTYTVEDVAENLVVLSGPSSKDYRFMNVTDEGVEIGLDLDKRDELKLGFGNAAASNSSYKMDREVYEILRAEPNISKENFFDAVHNFVVQMVRGEKKEGEKVTVIRTLAPVNTLVLYQQLETKPEMVTVKF